MERSSSGIRTFTEKDHEWLKVIECLKQSGLPIKEIKDFIDMAMQGDESSLIKRLALLQARRNAMKEQMKNMQETQTRSRACLKNACCQMCVTICGRFVPNEGRIAGYVT